MSGTLSAIWEGESERLDRVLPLLSLARSRSQAAELISSQRVRVEGTSVTKAGMKIAQGSVIFVDGGSHYVSRAAQKLLAGLDAFRVDPAGQLALDVGASTGGFTQVLLERGARDVLAVDVGHDQLAPLIRSDSRVRVVEGCNARELTAESLQQLTGVNESPSIIVADLSFISLELVFPALNRVAAEGAQFVLLIKPQFEVGRLGVNGGIVTDQALAIAAVARVIVAASTSHLECQGLRISPVTGEHGNTEVLAHFVRVSSPSAQDPREWEQRVRELFSAGGEA